MTPERIAEINRIARNLDRENPAYSALNEALDALESAQAEIAVDAGRLRDAAMRVWGEDAHGCDTPDRLADAILGLRAQIADLKRGGVVVPELTDEVLESAMIRKSITGHGHGAICFKIGYKEGWADRALRTIPADRVLGEGMVAVDSLLYAALINLEKAVVREWGLCCTGDRLWNGQKAIADRRDALRANQGGAEHV